MSRQYIIRRLLIAIPSLLGISVVLFAVLAMAPGDPFEELATNPAVPPEVRMALRAKFGLDDPIWTALPALARRHAAGRLGLLVRKPHGCRQADPAAPAGDADRDRLLADPRHPRGAIPVGVLAATRPYSVFDQIANTLAIIGFSLPTFFTGLVLILVFSIQLDWLPFVYRTDINAKGWLFYWEHIKQSIMPVAVLGLCPGRHAGALRAFLGARRHPAGLRDHRAVQGHR